jgi:hypothetical protein
MRARDLAATFPAILHQVAVGPFPVNDSTNQPIDFLQAGNDQNRKMGRPAKQTAPKNRSQEAGDGF